VRPPALPRRALLALLVLAALSAPAQGGAVSEVMAAAAAGAPVAAPPSCAGEPTLSDFAVESGFLGEGSACGRFLGSSQAAYASWSNGRYFLKAEQAAPLSLSVDVVRLSGEGRKSIELWLLGCVLLVRDDRVALWVSEATFDDSSFRAVPGLRTHEEHRLRAVQRPGAVTLEIDGKEVGSWAAPEHPPRGRIGLGMKGPPWARSRIAFRNLRAGPLAAGRKE
jgi:hypothetical protein